MISAAISKLHEELATGYARVYAAAERVQPENAGEERRRLAITWVCARRGEGTGAPCCGSISIHYHEGNRKYRNKKIPHAISVSSLISSHRSHACMSPRKVAVLCVFGAKSVIADAIWGSPPFASKEILESAMSALALALLSCPA